MGGCLCFAVKGRTNIGGREEAVEKQEESERKIHQMAQRGQKV